MLASRSRARVRACLRGVGPTRLWPRVHAADGRVSAERRRRRRGELAVARGRSSASRRCEAVDGSSSLDLTRRLTQ